MQKIDSINQLNWQDYIQENNLVVWGQAQSEPLTLTRHLMQNRHRLKPFKVFLGISNYGTCQTEHTDKIQFQSYCGAGTNRLLAKEKKLDIIPNHYSNFPQNIRADVVLIQISKPNALGQFSFALGQDYTADLIKNARVVIAEVNHQLPWVYSDLLLNYSDIDVMIETNREFEIEDNFKISEINQSIALKVAGIIPNDSTLQIGIGSLPEAVLSALEHHKNLGIHSGIISDGVAKLMQSGVINNSKKKIDTGYTVTGLINGSLDLHHFVDQNPLVQLRSTSYTHQANVLSVIDNLVAVNSAIEVDLTGQVNAEVANGNYVGGVGGALDFIRAANQSKFGFSIIALPSSGKNFSRIVSKLNGPVSTPRSDAAFFVTEYGVADLRGLSIAERAKKMIEIAHPDYREHLIADAKKNSII